MNNQMRSVALVFFLIAFFSPLWIVMIAMIGVDKEASQYGGLQSGVMGVYNLLPIILSLISLLLGRREKLFYIISIFFSVSSVIFMSIWAFGGAK